MKIRRLWLLMTGLILAPSVTVVSAGDFTFAVIGDRTGGHQPGIYADIVKEIALLEPDMVITVGDHIEGYTEDEAILNRQWDEYMGIIKALKMPVYLVPGNHDIFNDTMEQVWRKRIGKPPYYSFDFEKAHFVVLDNGRWGANAELPDKQVRWLEQDLKKNRNAPLTLVFFHKPLFTRTLEEGKPDRLHELFVKYGVDGVFCGHYHTYASSTYDGIPYVMLGSSGGVMSKEVEEEGSFFHYALGRVKNGRLSWAVLKKDSVLPPDLISFKDNDFLFRIDHEYVKILTPTIPEDPGVSILYVPLRIENPLDHPITATVRWGDAPGWTVKPQDKGILVDGGATVTENFAAILHGPLFPVPSFTLHYPWGGGKQHKVEGVLTIARTAQCTEADAPPVLDGILSEGEYPANPSISTWAATDGGACIIEPTRFYMVWDAANLYIGVHSTQEDPASLVANCTERDGTVFVDDCVGFFFAPETGEEVVYQVYFNAIGTPYDARITFPTEYSLNQDPAWNGRYEVKTYKGEGFWSLEARIPVENFGVKTLIPGTQWRFNCRRKEPSKKSTADFQVPIMAKPEDYGILAFHGAGSE